MSQQKTTQPLAGIKVVDFSTLLPGPLASLVLCDAGARVIKVERPGGDEMRAYPPLTENGSLTFELLNRGKKSVCLDLKNPHHLQALQPLLRDCDIVVEQFRPGVMERLGLAYKDIKKINPGVIYCSITGYGQTGPLANVAGHDLNYIAQTGLLSLASGPQGSPVVPPALIADIAGGSYPALVNILMALYAREKTGKGEHLDIAMTDNMFMLMSWALAQGLVDGKWPQSGRELLTGGSPRYQLYQTRDGQLLAAAPLEQRFWINFCTLLQVPDRLRDNNSDPQMVIDHIQAIIGEHDAKHWQTLFDGQDCCCCVVESLQQALQNPHFAHRGLFASAGDDDMAQAPTLPVCVVPQFSSRQSEHLSAPQLGEHNKSILD